MISVNNRRRRRVSAGALALSLTLLGAACSSDSKTVSKPTDDTEQTENTKKPRTTEDEPATTDAPETTDATETTDAPETTDTTDRTEPSDDTTEDSGGATTGSGSAGQIQGIDDAQSGAIQILAQGSLREPEIGTYSAASSGSGFFVSADGYAVTNNHVVTGAATLEVYVGGDTSKSYNAQVIGVSECNDLALIKVGVGGDVPYFGWYDGDVKSGLEVYAAGFPLGDPEFTLTKGIVAKAKAGGDLTGTSSIDHTIEHDAAIQPGNSGGPLLSDDGQVVGINYAGGQRDTGAQYYAISADLAEGVVDKLADGDFESLGINGFAVSDEDSGITGIWVSGVGAGTPASEAGVLPGDIITSMNGLPVGTDGTFKDYCDVIRTAGSKPISIEVLRFDTKEVLDGEINGDKPLVATTSFGEQVATDNSIEEGTAYTDYVTVTDDTGTLALEIPAEWSDVNTSPLDNAGTTFSRIEASPNIADYNSTYSTPGVTFLSVPSANVSPTDLLYGFGYDNCDASEVTDYNDGIFVGIYQQYTDCGGSGSIDLVLVSTLASGGSGRYFVTTIQAVTSADLDVLDHILSTFNAA